MDPETLDTIGNEPYTFGGQINPEVPFLAHMRIDHASKHMLGCNYSFTSRGAAKFTMYEFNENSRKSTKLRIPAIACVIHDFVFTPSFYVLILNPAAVKWFNLIKIGLGFQPLMASLGKMITTK